MLGLTGLLNWFGLPNPESLWRRSVVLHALADLLRPVSAVAADRPFALGTAWADVSAAWASSAVLERRLPMGHALWLTAWSFLFGLLVHRFDLRIADKSQRPAGGRRRRIAASP